MNATAQVFVLLDEASAQTAALDISSALAQLLQRRLQLVFVQSAAALAAVELSATRVLAHPTARWTRLAAPDIERAWQAQAQRLRTLAERSTQRRAVHWSLRVVRGALHDAALDLLPETDLLLLGGAAAAFAFGGQRAALRCITALDDGGHCGSEAVQLAERLAASLGARLFVEHLRRTPSAGHADAGPALPILPADTDLLVLPRTLAQSQALRTLASTPTLVVGIGEAERAEPSAQATPRAPRVGVVTTTGGGAAMAVDQLAIRGAEIVAPGE
ncbi:MAG: hypothetical protein GX886_05080, partial [Comamonadaceae bacterium]|nr:hypothetical protein [Comamonadaceae bacterium]